MEEYKEIDRLLQLLVGQFVWSVKWGVDTWLTMQFGGPHRVVYEPKQASEGVSAVVQKILARRHITIKGDVSLFVQNSQWSILTKDAAINWKSDEGLVREMVTYHLDGQKVLSAVRRVDETVLEFDLGTTVRLGKSIDPDDMNSTLWSIREWGSSSYGLLNSGAVAPSDWKDGVADT
jgi:hypothetical protein